MSRSSALKRPPAMPSAPAGETSVAVDRDRRRGRGTASNASGRFEPLARVAFDDGWQGLEQLPPFKTTVTIDATRKIITHNDSPDISFDRSINPYRGCEHGCVYCFARPTHAYLGLSPGLDFESKLFMKPNAPEDYINACAWFLLAIKTLGGIHRHRALSGFDRVASHLTPAQLAKARCFAANWKPNRQTKAATPRSPKIP